MKVSLFVHNLGKNPIVRAKPIADALEVLGHEVEVLGFLIGDDEVYAPFRNSYDYKVIKTSGYSSDAFRKSFQLARMATGEVAYACKPLLTSFFPALIYSGYGKRRRLFLDVEDDDVFARGYPGGGLLGMFRDIRKPDGYLPSLMLDRFVKNCSGVTVSSTKLSYIYGGRILLNGPTDMPDFHPIDSTEQGCQRERFGLPKNRIILLFAGKPTPHKGMDALMQVVGSEMFARHFHLALAGDSGNSNFIDLKRRGGDSCTLLGQVPYPKMSDIVVASDLVPVIQRREPYTESQIPAKLLEAMAYGRPCIASAVGDLPRLIGRDRGWVLDGGGGDKLGQLLLGSFADDPVRAKREMCKRGNAAREFYVSHFSPEVNAALLAQFTALAL